MDDTEYGGDNNRVVCQSNYVLQADDHKIRRSTKDDFAMLVSKYES